MLTNGFVPAHRADMTNPPSDTPTSAPQPTMAQDSAVIGWLAARRKLPDLTCALLQAALILWGPLLPLPSVTSRPDSDVGAAKLLLAITRRLRAHAYPPARFQTQMVLSDVHFLLGLAWYSLHDPEGARAGLERWEQHFDWSGDLRVTQTDAAVGLPLDDYRREPGE